MTVNNIMKTLGKWSDKWIEIAQLLNVPSPVINTINVLTSHQPNMNDEGALYKVVEWWFVNTANPEWTAIDDLTKISNGNT